jgi:AcrR family transcriptional regulator
LSPRRDLQLVEPPGHGRLWAADRRAQLLEVAAELLTREGADGVRIPDVAERAGVSRAVVYKFFPNRQAILLDLLEELGRRLQQRVEASLADEGLADVDVLLARLFNDVCDTVTELGAGVWRLLNSAGPDPDIESVARRVRAEVAGPWFARVQAVTGAPERDAFALTSMIAATIPAVVELWLSGQVERDEAVVYLERGVAGLIREFTRT